MLRIGRWFLARWMVLLAPIVFGALLVAALEIAAGLWFIKRGVAAFGGAPYSLPDTRAGLKILKG